MPNAKAASASTVLYPSSMPVKNAPVAYAPVGSMAAGSPRGAVSARSSRMANTHKNRGLSTLPIQVRICPGRRDRASTTAKNASENTASATPCHAPAGSTRSMPTVYETVAHRGMAKNGPMVRYSAQVKNSP